MATQLACESMDELFNLLEERKDAENIFILFSGESDLQSGQSWCPDCVKAEPIIEKGVSTLGESSVFIFCSVGDRPTWKDPQNVFRTHPKFKLNGIPTLMKWNTPQRLGPDECSKEDLVTMLFGDD